MAYETESSSTNYDETLDEIEEEIFFIACLVALVSQFETFFNENELGKETSVDRNAGVRDVLATMSATPVFFKTLTNFSLQELHELCNLVCPLLSDNARPTGREHIIQGRPLKLNLEQRLLNFILFMRHDNIVNCNAICWNWARSSVCDDQVFVASCINQAISNEIRWPNVDERQILGTRVPAFQGCIGVIDGTLIKIGRPKHEDHATWFNGRKKIYAYNNTVIVDHNGLFIHLDLGFPGSAHDVNILYLSSLHQNWRQYFTHTNEYFEYLLGDPRYMEEEKYTMSRLGTQEVPVGGDVGDISAYNKMHAGYWIKVERGIGGLKQKWRRLMKRFDCTCEKYVVLVMATTLFTNFVQRSRQDLAYKVIGEQHGGENYGWDGDF